MSNNILIIVVCVYIIVYIVTSIYKPPIENYVSSNSETSNSETSNSGASISNSATNSEGLSKTDINKFIEKLKLKDNLFLEQEKKQNVQNREISLIKQKISDFRNDLLVLRNNEKKQIETITRDDLQDDEMEKEDNNYSNNVSSTGMSQKSNISGKSYNLNFNLDED